MMGVYSVVTAAFLAALIHASKAQLECARYPLCADSMFDVPTIIETRFVNSFIDNVTLFERHSYYKCEPKETTYGINPNSKEWWVFRGCGGVFEVRECTEKAKTQLIQKPKEQIKSHHREIDRKCREQLGLIKDEVTMERVKTF